MIRKLIARRVTTTMIFAAICLLGLISLQKLPVQLLPDMEFPKLTVITPYENSAPTEIEKLVTRHIEESVSSVNGVVSIYSESLEGLSIVTARFNWDTDMDMALVETKEKVDLIKGQLPEDTEKSIVVKYDPKAEPIMIIAVNNVKGSFKKIRKRVEKELLPYIERVDGVALVEVTGGYKRQINVALDAGKIFAHQLSMYEVSESISMANQNFPAGSIEKDNKEYLVRTIGEFSKVKELEQVVVGRNEQGIPIYLKSVGKINDTYKDRKNIIRINGMESVALLIKKEPGKNTIQTADNIDELLTKLQTKYNKDLIFTKVFDESEFIRTSVGNVYTSALIGGLIALFVLFFFLKEARSPFIISAVIPISIIGTFALMFFKNVSINTMSLGGLALAVGMMVDSGIVVLESIAGESSGKKKSPLDMVLKGTEQVFSSVVASILTSIVVFLPIVFLQGLSGEIFSELAITISFALLLSLITSITLIPMLSVVLAERGKGIDSVSKNESGIVAYIHGLSDRFMHRAESMYKGMIEQALEKKKHVIATGIILSLCGIILFVFIKKELMPAVDPGEFTIDIEATRGTPLKESSALSQRIEAFLLEKPYIKSIFAKIGSDPDENISEKTSGRRSHNILIKVLLKKDRSQHIQEIISELKNELNVSEHVKVNYLIKESVVESLISSKKKALHIEIAGENVSILKQLGDGVVKDLAAHSSIKNPSALLSETDPEYKIEVDRNRMTALGLTIEDVASTIRAAIHGDIATKFRENDDEVDVRVRLQHKDRVEKSSLYKILVKTKEERAIPIYKFTDIQEGVGSSKIIRNQQSRVNIITADIKGDVDSIIEELEPLLQKRINQEGYSSNIISQKDEIKKTFGEMQFALILAIILIYMLLASQFQSFKNPLIVMLSIPVTAPGVSIALFLTGKSLNINSGIGVILLTGLVVNNAIVLIDFITKERKTKSLNSAIISAGVTRLKPILMTTCTTIFAMIPIALGIGQGSELQQPMAIAVIGGLVVSTFLTLIFIPTVYASVNQEGK